MRVQLRHTAILALPSLINAVALSDMTPRATGLPEACNDVYTAQIGGCAPSDFSSGQCSSGCVGALDALVGRIQRACANQGVQGENLVVAFLAGLGPEQLCKNAGAVTSTASEAPPTSSTKQQTSTAKPSIISGTTTAHKASDTSSLAIDTSSRQTHTVLPTKTHTSHKHTTQQTSMSSVAPPESSSIASSSSESTNSPTTAGSPTKTGSGSYQTNMNDGSGGGSPFDSQGNMGSSAAGVSISALSLLIPAALGLFAAMR